LQWAIKTLQWLTASPYWAISSQSAITYPQLVMSLHLLNQPPLLLYVQPHLLNKPQGSSRSLNGLFQ
jgi:hypothetical protein